MSTFPTRYIHFELTKPHQDETCFYIPCYPQRRAGHVEAHLKGKYAHLIIDEQDGVISQTVVADGYTQILWDDFVRMADHCLNS